MLIIIADQAVVVDQELENVNIQIDKEKIIAIDYRGSVPNVAEMLHVPKPFYVLPAFIDNRKKDTVCRSEELRSNHRSTGMCHLKKSPICETA